MRKKVLTLLLAVIPMIGFADVELTREEASAIKSYDLEKLQTIVHDSEGKIVKLKFNYRSGLFDKGEDGTIKSSIQFWQGYQGNRSFKSGGINVSVPGEGANWFLKIPTSYEKRSSIVVFARIEKEENGAHVAKLLGREIKTDSRGSRIIW